MRTMTYRIARLLLLLSLAGIVLNVVLVGLTYQELGIGLLLGMTYRLTRKRFSASGSYGTARQAGLPDLLAGNLQVEKGLILGRVNHAARPTRGQALRWLISPTVSSEWAVRTALAAFGSRRAGGDFIRVRDYVHLATFAPAGGGKSVSVLYPNLLSYDGNCVVIDPKGELYRTTAHHRAQTFNHQIVRLDPAGLCGPGADAFNSLDYIDPNRPEFIEDCRDLANMLVVRTGKEMDPHWCDSAENVIAAFIAYISALEGNPDARSLYGVRTKIASRDEYHLALEVMQKQQGFYGVLEELGNSLKWHVDRELGSVLSHAQRFTHIFGAPLVAKSISSTTFDPMRLRTGRMTVYLITPPDKMVTWASLQRLWMGSLLRIITRGVPTESNPVLFLVDECAHIGRMQVLEDAVTLMRGMGIRLWLFFQSIEQLKKCFGENAGTVLDNLATQQYFAINSYETAEAISKRIGDATIMIRTEGDNRGISSPTNGDGKTPGSRSSGSNTTTQEAARRLLKPEEILTLPENSAIVFHKNHYVIVCEKIKYYADHAFMRRGIRRRYGTGRSRGHAFDGLVMGLVALALAAGVTAIVARLPVPQRHRPAAARPSPDFGYDAAYGPGSYPLPYQQGGGYR